MLPILLTTVLSTSVAGTLRRPIPSIHLLVRVRQIGDEGKSRSLCRHESVTSRWQPPSLVDFDACSKRSSYKRSGLDTYLRLLILTTTTQKIQTSKSET